MEFWGTSPGTVSANVHTGDYNHTKGTGRGGKIKVDKPWEDFHIYAVEWYPDRLDFYFDKTKYYSCIKKDEGIGEWPFDAPQYLLINLALTAGKEGIDDSIFPTEYRIDYVRIYEMKR
jgi:beta-glucanase (GH16 family)